MRLCYDGSFIMGMLLGFYMHYMHVAVDVTYLNIVILLKLSFNSFHSNPMFSCEISEVKMQSQNELVCVPVTCTWSHVRDTRYKFRPPEIGRIYVRDSLI